MKTFFKHNMKTRAQEKTERRKRVAAERRKAYAAVEVRDGMRCRCCGRLVSKTAHPMSPSRLEHHHIQGRGFEGAETTANLCLLCKVCHDRRHHARTLTMSGNADVRNGLTFSEHGREWSG